MLSLILKITHQKIKPFPISCERNLISVLELKIFFFMKKNQFTWCSGYLATLKIRV